MDKIKVLIAVGDSEIANNVTNKALSFLDKNKVEITLLNVMETIGVETEYFYKAPEKFIEHEAGKSNFTLIENFIINNDFDYKGFIYKEGDAAKIITDTANKENFDIIVMGTHNKKGLKKIILGSVSYKVSRHAKSPVIIIKPADSYEQVLDKSYSVLVGVDGSKCSTMAVKSMHKFLDVSRAEVNVVNVVLPLQDVIPVDAYIYTDISKVIEESKIVSNEILDEANNTLIDNGFNVKKVISLMGNPPEMILKESEDTDIDLIILGSHGKTGIMGWFLGSVSSKVINHSKTSIMIVKKI